MGTCFRSIKREMEWSGGMGFGIGSGREWVYILHGHASAPRKSAADTKLEVESIRQAELIQLDLAKCRRFSRVLCKTYTHSLPALLAKPFPLVHWHFFEWNESLIIEIWARSAHVSQSGFLCIILILCIYSIACIILSIDITMGDIADKRMAMPGGDFS